MGNDACQLLHENATNRRDCKGHTRSPEMVLFDRLCITSCSNRFSCITIFTPYVTVCDLEKPIRLDTTATIIVCLLEFCPFKSIV